MENSRCKDQVLTHPDLLPLILSYALDTASQQQHQQESDKVLTRISLIKKCMGNLSRLRTVCSEWKKCLDDDPLSFVWFLMAQTLNLDPPLQLYSGGSYQQVCKILLQDLIQQNQNKLRDSRRRHYHRTACRMRRPESRPPHPNPSLENMPRGKLADKTCVRLAHTAHALEQFLKSINFSTKIHGEDDDYEEDEKPHATQVPNQWHQQAWLRYRMFLYLKQLHPNTWLIPTADIEFCWLAHIFRTEVYWKDMKALGINPSHSLLLKTKGQEAAFLDAVKGTAALWEATFNDVKVMTSGNDKKKTTSESDPKNKRQKTNNDKACNSVFINKYLPDGFEQEWKARQSKNVATAYWQSWATTSREVALFRLGPFSFFPEMGTTTQDADAGAENETKVKVGDTLEKDATLEATRLVLDTNNIVVPEISLTAAEIQADLAWFPQLQRALWEIQSKSYDILGGGRVAAVPNNDIYLEHLVPSYQRFLNLCYKQIISRNNDPNSAAPPYALDLIWHAHQSDPEVYKRDCLELFGCEFYHHPWPNGLGISSEVSKELECAWKKEYGCSMKEDWELYVS